ncbi:MAG: YcaO-like family protein [Proteobacteria bacterium]|nr:YcaO-like family protein [Pseudomonadota bacterium]
MSAPIELKDCFKTYTLDQDKVYSPAETVARVRGRFESSGLDVLRETTRIDNGRMGIPVYVSVCGADALRVMPTKKQMGKGATPEQAEASAVMELAERYSFFHYLRRTRFQRASYEEVRDRALPFEHLAASVHHDPGDLDRALDALRGLPLDWTPAYNLTRGREYLIPFSWFYEINQFNGPAAGNTMEEAVVQGLAEVVERHVSALVCRSRLLLPSIDPDSIRNPVGRELIEKFNRQGVNLYLKDFTLDMGLATVGAMAVDPETFPSLSEIVFTAGTATDPEKALIRALTEVAQLGGDFNTGARFEPSGLPKYARLEQAEYLTRSSASVPIGSLPDISHDNIRTEIETLVRELARRGLEAYAVNITHPRLDVPAVYNIVPGAHFRERAVASSVPFFAAKLLMAAGDFAAVFAGLGRLRALYPEAHYLHFFEGQALLDEGRPVESIELFEQARRLDPPAEDLAGILTYLGLAYQQLEAFDRSIDVLERSAEVDDERRDTFNLLGFGYFKTKQHEKAITAFERVLEIDPGSGIDHANIGTNYRELGRYDQAVRYYRRALMLDPDLDWVRDNLDRLSPLVDGDESGEP